MKERQISAAGLVIDEAAAIDGQEWEKWAECFTDDAVIWAPTWLDETTLTTDPQLSISHFYLVGKDEIADRIWRIQSGLSPFSVPQPRTLHQVTNFRYSAAGGVAEDVKVLSNWVTLTYRRKKTHMLFGHYEHVISFKYAHPKVTSKKIILLNDYVDIPFDLNNV